MKKTLDYVAAGAGPALGPRDFEQIRALAYGSFGLDLKPGKEELVSARLRRLLRNGKFESFQKYYQHVVADHTGNALATMIDALATNHTAFFRESDHFTFLREHVLPGMVHRDPIELWTAACSTGEEVWTLAMVLNEVFPNRRISILATDISNKALRQALAAEYASDRCEGIPPGFLKRYFVPGGGPLRTFCVAPRLRSQATFQRINLVENATVGRLYPVIFCRNVMIYFDRETQERVVARLANSLEPGGYLFVGHAESLTRISHSLEYVRPAVYRKPGQKEGRWSKSL